ncbi:MAG: hypothetical protein JSR93_05835 [Verrucomicrobia bacterium]|nr:hypothetical protein [Verrucomicrobiota bacterium]
MISKAGFWLRQTSASLGTDCIAQLDQVELLRRRFTVPNLRRWLCQIPNFGDHLCIEEFPRFG